MATTGVRADQLTKANMMILVVRCELERLSAMIDAYIVNDLDDPARPGPRKARDKKRTAERMRRRIA